MNEVTRILSALQPGDRDAAEQLLPLVYEELRKLAAQRPRPGHCPHCGYDLRATPTAARSVEP
jgi:hypothetical protein